MSLFRLITLITLFILAAFIHPAAAGEFHCEVIQYATDIEINNGRLFKKVSVDIRINDPSGDYYAWISIPWKDGSKPKVTGWIEDNQGNVVRKLKKKDITEESAISSISFYEDQYELKFVLKHNVYPYVVHYEYETVQDEFFHITNWFPVHHIKVPTRQAKLSLSTPRDFPVHLYSRDISAYHSDTLPDRITYKWLADYSDPVESEVFSPPLTELLPNVSIAPVNFTYGLPGSLSTWQSFGAWQFNLNTGLTDLPASEAAQVERLTRDASGKKEVLKRLYKYLQRRTRYINITLGIGGLKPHPAEYVAQNKYGDCKALSNYMKALLEQVNIKSYYTLINAGRYIGPVIKEFPSQQFNHAILFVPLEDDSVWLECTANSIPFAYLGTGTQNRQALVIDGDKSRFVATPALSMEDVAETMTGRFSIGNGNACDFIILSTLRRDNYESLNYISTQFSDTEKREFINNRFPSNFRIDTYRIDEQGLEAELELEVKGSADNYVSAYGNDLAFRIYPADIPGFESPKKRKLPVRIPYPVYRTDTLIYDFPAAFSPILPTDETWIKSKYGAYSLAFSVESNTLTIIRTFQLHRQEIALAEYNEFYAFLDKIKGFDKKNILLKRQ